MPSVGGGIEAKEPVVCKWVTTYGTTAVVLWSPAAGKKFRVKGGVVIYSGSPNSAGDEKMQLLDEAADMGLNFQVRVSTSIEVHIFPFSLGEDGKLSSTVDNDLKFKLGRAIANGNASVFVWGTEE